MLKPLKKETTLSDQAYQIIRNAITCGDFAAGDTLTEESLSSELLISRTPLRAALNRLTADGLLESNGKSLVVTRISTDDAVKISAVRQKVELLCVEELRGKVTKTLIRQLRKCVREQRAIPMADALDYVHYIQIDAQFHNTLAHGTGNKYLSDIVERLQTHSSRCLMLSSTLEKSSKIAVDEHEKIVDCLENNDIDGAVASMLEHVKGVELRLNDPSRRATP